MRTPKHLLILALMLCGIGTMLINSDAMAAQSGGPVCVQDDANPSLRIQFDTPRRGKANFTIRDCSMGILLMGTADVSESGVERIYRGPMAKVVVNLSTNTARGLVFYLNSGPSEINDSNTVNSTCWCQ